MLFYPANLFLHRRFLFDNCLTGEGQWNLFDFINSLAMCLAEFIYKFSIAMEFTYYELRFRQGIFSQLLPEGWKENHFITNQ